MHIAPENPKSLKPESPPTQSRVEDSPRMINLSNLVLEIAPLSLVQAPTKGEASEHVSKDVTTSGKTTSQNFAKIMVKIMFQLKRGQKRVDILVNLRMIMKLTRKDRKLIRFMDSVLRGVDSGVLPDVSTSEDNKPTDGSNKKEDCVTKERRSKKKEDIYVNLDEIESDEELTTRTLAPSVARRLRKIK